MYSMGIVVSGFQLLRYRKQFESLITRLINNMEHHNLVKIRASVIIISSVWLVIVFIEFVTTSYVRREYLNESGTALVYISCVKASIEASTNWIDSSCGFYFIALQLLLFYQKRLIHELMDHLSSGRMHFGYIRSCVKLIRDSSRQFDQLLSFMPFMWFSYGILEPRPTS